MRENIEPTLPMSKASPSVCRARPSNPCTWLADWLQANNHGYHVQHRSNHSPGAAELLAAAARYATTADLRKLLTYDEERGGIPIRLLSAPLAAHTLPSGGNGDGAARAPSVARARAPGGVCVGRGVRARARRAGGAHGQVARTTLVSREVEKHGRPH